MNPVESDSVTMPLVTIYMPTKNRATLMRRAALSVLNQTYTNIELIVVDDNSTDETATVLAELTEDERVRVFTNSGRGACSARNLAITNAKGEYITGLDDDDYFLPSRIAEFVSHKNTNAAFLCASSIWHYGGFQKVIDAQPGYFTLAEQLSYNEASNQVFVLTERLRAISGFDENFVACQDYDTWTRLMIAFGSAYRLPTPTYVVDDNSGCERMIDNPKSVKGYEQFLAKHQQLMSRNNKLNQQFMRWVRVRHRLSFGELLKLLTVPRRVEKLRYFVSSNYPFLSALRHRLLKRFKPTP